MSPTIYRQGSYRFYFNSNEEHRMHVHIKGQQGRAKFWLEPIIALADYRGFKIHELKEIEQIVIEHQKEFEDAWKSTSPKNIIDQAQITSIEQDGFWLLIEESEFFVAFERYPAFQRAKVEQIFNFEQDEDAFYWPELDIDIELDALKHPEKYPLIFRD